MIWAQSVYKATANKTFTNSTQNYHSPISQKLEFKGGVLLQNTPVTLYACPPVSTNLATRDRLRDCRNLRQSTVIYGNLLYSAMTCHILPTCFYCNIYNIRNVRDFCWILPSLLNFVKFCQDYNLKPILPHTRVNWVIKLIIYTPFFYFLISFPYAISWFYYTVHVRSLIISTLLYIIATCTHSVTE